MAKVVPYLRFNGNTEEAFKFYRAALGGEFASLQRFSDTPQKEHLPEKDRHKIMHLSLETADGMTLMGGDHLESMGLPLVVGNNIHVSLHPDNEAEASSNF